MLYHKLALGMAASSLMGLLGLSACSDSQTNNSSDLGSNTDIRMNTDLTPQTPKGVYTMSNEVAENKIYAYTRAADGTLTPLGSYTTGGKGTGAGLGNQNGLVFDAAQNRFFVVNAGDNTISMLALQQDGSLSLLTKVLSGGLTPVSITVSGSTVFVVNAGDAFTPSNISGFQISGNTLTPIAGSIKPLSIATPGPAQIQFAANGAVLVVTEKMTSKIDTYTVAAGVPTGPMVQPSKGTTPFGFAFSGNGKLIVSEAFTANPNMGATSSYSLDAAGTLTAVSSSVQSGQTAPCWVAVAGNTAYVTNAQSNNITAYTIGTDGALTLVGNGASAQTGMGPTDEDVTDNNEFLYVLNSRDHSISAFAINADKTLTKKQDFPGIPQSANGLVAR
ncbi:MAG: hypothetical protein U1A78_03885 [Polyangia bacterium]